MKKHLLNSKIHRATVTEANLNYMGSITIPGDLMKMVDLDEFEYVQVVNINNGARFQTYVIRGPEGSAEICLNGAAARMAQIGDRVIIMSSVELDREEISKHSIKMIVMDENNRIISKTGV